MGTNTPEMEQMCNQINQDLQAWNAKWGPVLKDVGSTGDATTASARTNSSSNQTQQPGRVLGRPEFDETEMPVDFTKSWTTTEENVVHYQTLTKLP